MKLREKTTATLLILLMAALVVPMAFAPRHSGVGPTENADGVIEIVKVETVEGSLKGILAQSFEPDAEIKFEAKINHYDDGSIDGEAELTVSDLDSKFEAKWEITSECDPLTHQDGGITWLYYGGTSGDVEFESGETEETYEVTGGRFGSWEKTFGSNGPDKLNIVVVSAGEELLRVTGSTITELEYILPLFPGWGAQGSGEGEVVVEIKDSTFRITIELEGTGVSTDYQVHFGYLTPSIMDKFGSLTPWAHWVEPRPLVSWVQLGEIITDSEGNGELIFDAKPQTEQLFTGIFAINNNPGNTVLHTGAYPNTRPVSAIDTISFAVK